MGMPTPGQKALVKLEANLQASCELVKTISKERSIRAVAFKVQAETPELKTQATVTVKPLHKVKTASIGRPMGYTRYEQFSQDKRDLWSGAKSRLERLKTAEKAVTAADAKKCVPGATGVFGINSFFIPGSKRSYYEQSGSTPGRQREF